MRLLLADLGFWVAVAVAVALKIKASPTVSPIGAVVTVLIALGAALIFTQPIVVFLALDGAVYTNAVAALVALSAEHLSRQILDLKIMELIAAWRGKK